MKKATTFPWWVASMSPSPQDEHQGKENPPRPGFKAQLLPPGSSLKNEVPSKELNPPSPGRSVKSEV